MDSPLVQDPKLLVLSKVDGSGSDSNAKGHLFEEFIGQLLHLLGYEKPTRDRLNVNASGIELDLSLVHSLDRTRILVECKAYKSNIASAELSAFYGKLNAGRLDGEPVRGIFVASPRLTADGREFAEKIVKRDPLFRTLNAREIWDILLDRKIIGIPASDGLLLSDPALIIHRSGIYAAHLEISPESKTASRVLVKAMKGGVSPETLDLLAAHEYAQGLDVINAVDASIVAEPRAVHRDPIVVEVRGSGSNFEYQFPASPKYFIGRRAIQRAVVASMEKGTRLLVLNAQSGWGKSSFALKLADSVNKSGGHAFVTDARTATSSYFIPSVLRRAAERAQTAGILKLPNDSTWPTMSSALKAISEAEWKSADGSLLIFFDQFENVFKDPELTRDFRDLALLALDSSARIVVAFAWKTDFVGWTESHPYQLRDEIRGNAKLVSLEPFGPGEVDTLLKRLQEEVGEKLSREIRQRLREYSQGLPWLLKKLAGHLIKEIRDGKSQEQLVAEALNVENLFEDDLASLSSFEAETVRFIARFAPVQASEVMERFSPGVVQSLLDQRLVVQVGEKLDTYWDTFRDYLNTGRAPIEDSYILRQTPSSVSRLLSFVIEHGGSIAVADVASSWDTSENAVWNIARELRQLGLTQYRPNLIVLASGLNSAANREEEVRRRSSAALRRHRAFSAYVQLAERSQGLVSSTLFAKQLESVFPAVEVTAKTWGTYARVFLAWFEYAGLVSLQGNSSVLAPDGFRSDVRLTSSSSRSRSPHVFPTSSPGRGFAILEKLWHGPIVATGELDSADRKAIGQLVKLGAASVNSGTLFLDESLRGDGGVNKAGIIDLLGEVRGGRRAIELLTEDPATSPMLVGNVLKAAQGTEWKDSTTELPGKYFRKWAKYGGIDVKRASFSTY